MLKTSQSFATPSDTTIYLSEQSEIAILEFDFVTNLMPFQSVNWNSLLV